jgi:hypothetical protein
VILISPEIQDYGWIALVTKLLRDWQVDVLLEEVETSKKPTKHDSRMYLKKDG